MRYADNVYKRFLLQTKRGKSNNVFVNTVAPNIILARLFVTVILQNLKMDEAEWVSLILHI